MQIRLASYGYIFVAKITNQHLKHLQGIVVPIYLANINLVERYYPDFSSLDCAHASNVPRVAQWRKRRKESKNKTKSSLKKFNALLQARIDQFRRLDIKRLVETKTELSHANRP